MSSFSWIPVFEAVSSWIGDYEERQDELLALLTEIGVDKGLTDTDADGNGIPLSQIDPFTFFALFMKYGHERREQLFRALLKRINSSVTPPSDFNGVPSAQAQRVRLFPPLAHRTPDMIPTLWELFRQARDANIKEETFAKALTIPSTGFAKLTECLFYAFPRRYLPVDGQTRPWLKRQGINVPSDWASYQQCMEAVRAASNKPFHEISYEAWRENMDEAFSAQKAMDYLSDRYPDGVAQTVHLFAACTPTGRELAFDPGAEGKRDEKRTIGLFLDADPSDLDIGQDVKRYAKDKGRNSNLRASAPTLSVGNVAYQVKVKDLATLESICDWYDGEKIDSQHQGSDSKEEDQMIKTALNTILYGPPGTGKTYATTDMAVRIADPRWYSEQSTAMGSAEFRAALKQHYEELVKNERIVFTTFHQSFSYEDFIEGIRAETNDETNALEYRVEDGVFKRICDNADKKVLRNEGLGEQDITKRKFWKMSLGNTQKDESEDIFSECIDNDYVLLGWGGSINFSGCSNYDEVRERYLQEKPEEKREFAFSTVNRFINEIGSGDIIVVSAGNTRYQAIAEVVGDYEYLDEDERERFFQSRKVRWLKVYEKPRPVSEIYEKIFSQQTLYKLKSAKLKFDEISGFLAKENTVSEPEPYVLIIDEINRGNISRIFGELITLLESDKRKGGADERSAVLPYSKKSFQVPSNVYVIGTMNTADRSLAQLDLALRRRFSFIETPPQPELLRGVVVHDIDMADLLDTINQRIEVLLDRDHLLGHAYLFPLKGLSTEEERVARLGQIFRNNIIPLLQEYFFDDWERIRWVLNDHRKKSADAQFITNGGNTNLQQLFGSELHESLSERRFRVNADALYNPDAYRGILHVTDSQAT